MLTLALAASYGLSAQSDITFLATGNPVFKYKYTADPEAMTYNQSSSYHRI